MDVTLYQNYSENNAINKNIVKIADITAICKGPVAVENPILIIEYSSSDLSANYAYVAEYGRYYYINNITALTGGRLELTLSVDVLMSFSSAILTMPVIVDKQEQLTIADKYFNDGSYLATQKEFVRIKEFASGFNDSGTYILIACGG